MVAIVRALLTVAVGGLVFAACTSGSADQPTPRRPGPVVPLTPSIPGLFRTGVQHCGDPYVVTATTLDKTIPLADCPGLVGLRPLPVATVAVGGELTIAGLRANAFLTAAPGDLLQAHGSTFVALRQGTVLIIVHGLSCVPDSSGAQRDTCPLLKLHVN
jgi:hypothetical protein